MAAHPDFVLQAVGGVPLILLGIAVLFLPRRRADALLLAGFCLSWAAAVEIIATVRLTGLDASSMIELLAESAGAAANLIAGGCVVGFVAWPRVRRRHRLLVTSGIAAALVIGAIGILMSGRVGLQTASVVYQACFSSAVVIAYVSYRRAAPGTHRQRERLLLIALTFVPAFSLAGFSQYPASLLPNILALAPIAVVHAHALLRPPPPERRDVWLAVAFLLPFASGALFDVGFERGNVGVSGLWRFATAACLAFAIARSRLFDVELRLRRAAGPGLATLATFVGLVVGAAFLAGGAPLSLSAAPAAMGLGAGAMLLAVREPLGDHLFPIEGERDAYVRARKLEVYAAAVRAAVGAGLGADDDEVRQLRRSFGVTDAEQAAVLAASIPREERRLVLSRYRLLHALGEGGQGSVFFARDERTGADVAVKIVSRYATDKAAERLLSEARLASALDHRHIVRIIAADLDGDDAVLVMEYAAGGSLRALLQRRGGKLNADEAVRLAHDVFAALSACHARGIVHGDVKPENVLLSTDGRAILADFGVARQTTASATVAIGNGFGTLLYLAPEQVRGSPPSPASDVYAACVLLHEALTGHHPLPIAGRDDFQIRQLIMEGASPEPGVRHAATISAGLRARPDERPTAAELRRILADDATGH